MLPFMNEQGFDDSSAQHSADTTGGTGSDDAGRPQEQEYLTVANRDKNVRKSTTLLTVLFVVGILCLWFMIKKSVPQASPAAAAGAEEKQIETAISHITGVRSEMFDRMDEIVSKFYEFSNVQQIKLNELAKNPFKRETSLGNIGVLDNKNRDSATDAEQLRQQQIRQQMENMQLFSIMKSDNKNCCMINDSIVYEGDSIGSFKVIQIGDGFVKLESEGVELILKLQE